VYFKKSWLILFLALISNSAFGSVMKPGCKVASDIERYQRSMWLEGTRASQVELIACIDDAWKFYDTEENTKSAEFTYFSSSYLLSALQFNLGEFVVETEKRPDLISKWLKNIEYDIFTWRDDPPCGRQSQIDQVKSLLVSQKRSLSHFKTYHRLYKRFEKLKCHMID